MLERVVWGIGMAVGLGVLVPSHARATAADSALITNTVGATFWSTAGISSALAYRVSYLATASVFVACPQLGIRKDVYATTLGGTVINTTFQAAGGTVTYRIWVGNTSFTSSAFNVVVTDQLPDNTDFRGRGAADWYGGATCTRVYSIDAGATWPGPDPAAGAVNPLLLRWRFNTIGMGKSAYVEFMARVL
jgi:uncharacterized repeat protein (TIGR01451 family)